MTTVAKRRGLRQRIAELLVEWIYPEIQAKDEAIHEAAQWDAGIHMTSCISCTQPIQEHATYCDRCGVRQKEPKKEETQPLYSIQLGPEKLFFQQSTTGQLQINGKRPRQAYIEQLQRSANDPDYWTR